jgi:hypothetical protein
VASGRINTSQQIGGAIGLAVLTAVASGRTDSVVGEVGRAVALNEGFQLALLVAAGIVVVAVALTAIVGRGPRRTRPSVAPRPARSWRRGGPMRPVAADTPRGPRDLQHWRRGGTSNVRYLNDMLVRPTYFMQARSGARTGRLRDGKRRPAGRLVIAVTLTAGAQATTRRCR